MIGWIIAVILYVIGSIGSLGASAFLITSGGRSPCPREMGWIILWVLFWPIFTPFFIIKVLISFFHKK